MQEAAAYWSAKAATGYAPNWFSLCADEITRRITGQSAIPATMHTIRLHFDRPVSSFLEIGCLEGNKVAATVKAGLALTGTGVDVASDAVARGKLRHGELIDLHVMDLNHPHTLGKQFEIIHAGGVLHHIENLEACSDWICEHLAPGGILIASEYTGPVRYRYSAREIALINDGVAMLPPELRAVFDPAILKPKLDADPSESVRSRDIPDVLDAAGLKLDLAPYGGNILQRALGPHFFRGFDPRRTEHVEALEALVLFDEQVMVTNPSHHHFIVGRHAE